jgi:hypothetical protein
MKFIKWLLALVFHRCEWKKGGKFPEHWRVCVHCGKFQLYVVPSRNDLLGPGFRTLKPEYAAQFLLTKD